MSNKRSKRKKVQSFSCPFCETRLWRLGSPKHHIFYKNAGEMRRNLQISAKKASFLANQSSTCLDNKTWIEEFFCPTDGKMWLYLSHRNQEELSYRLAKREDWQQTDKTFNPDNRNPSISEFSYRVSRKGYYKFH